MKRIILLLIVILLMLFSYYAGELHAIMDSVIYTVEGYDPENPLENEWNGYDYRIFIELDGQKYVHGIYQC